MFDAGRSTPRAVHIQGMNPTGNPQPFLSLHTAVILLIALVIGFVIGALTLATGAPAAAAVIAGITSAGVSVVPLRGLIQ